MSGHFRDFDFFGANFPKRESVIDYDRLSIAIASAIISAEEYRRDQSFTYRLWRAFYNILFVVTVVVTFPIITLVLVLLVLLRIIRAGLKRVHWFWYGLKQWKKIEESQATLSESPEMLGLLKTFGIEDPNPPRSTRWGMKVGHWLNDQIIRIAHTKQEVNPDPMPQEEPVTD